MKKILMVIILLLVVVFLYGHFIEVNNIKVLEYNLSSENIPDSFKELKIVHFSDILYDKNEKLLEKVINLINKQNPDVVIFSGDLFKSNINYDEDDYKYLLESLKKINVNLAKYAVIGDNDLKYIEKYKDILYESSFTLLDNENKLFFYKDEIPINIIGLSDTSNINELLNTEIETNYQLVITHKPDNITALDNLGIDLFLSGHSLGGIINIPGVGGIIKKDGASTYLNKYYEDKQLYINNGIGYEKFNFRLLNNPSINVYRFV